MDLRSEYNYDMDAASLASGTTFDPKEDRTQQQFREDADLNVMIRRFGIGVVAAAPVSAAFGDFSTVVDFHSAMDAVARAREEFNALPAELREEFGNDPGALLDFMSDASNYDEAVELGLAVARPPVEAPVVPPVPPAPVPG